MLGRRIGFAAALAAIVLGGSDRALGAEWPPGPRLSYVRSGPPIAGDQVISAEPSGERWFKVATTWSLLGVDRLSYSPDGSTLAIGGVLTPAVLVTSADHVEPRPLRGTRDGFAPVFSPDGKSLAFARLRIDLRKDREPSFAASVWIVPASGGQARQLTPWREEELLAPVSFSPDGSRMTAERRTAEGGREALLMPVRGGKARRLAKNAADPVFSPDGTEIVVAKFVPRPPERRRKKLPASTDLFVLDRSGQTLRRLTRTPGRSEGSPSWDPSGERIVFSQLPARGDFFWGSQLNSSIAEINADGSCRHKVAFTLELAYGSPVWQPGPGREAGRIEC